MNRTDKKRVPWSIEVGVNKPQIVEAVQPEKDLGDRKKGDCEISEERALNAPEVSKLEAKGKSAVWSQPLNNDTQVPSPMVTS